MRVVCALRPALAFSRSFHQIGHFRSLSSAVDTSAPVPPPAWLQRSTSLVSSVAAYSEEHARSLRDPSGYWGEVASQFHWRRKWDSVSECDMATASFKWFSGGTLNITENALDRHIAAGRGDEPAMTWESDEGSSTTYTFRQVLSEVNAVALALKERSGVRPGDVVTIYLPMIPALFFTMLACARLGAIHSVVFAGFSDAALAERIASAGSRVLVTADAGVRGGKPVPLKPAVDRACAMAEARGARVASVLVTHRAGTGVGAGSPGWVAGRDVDLDAEVAGVKARSAARGEEGVRLEAQAMGAEDPLFLLYTSGSTGKPKGVVHTTGGYMVYAAHTFKHMFDAAPPKGAAAAAAATGASAVTASGATLPLTHFCAADLGWITGHSYIAYAPLLNGVHTVLFEGTPLHPTPARLWQLCAKHRVTSLYTAPTAIRALMVHGAEPFAGLDLSSLRVIGSVGEPIGSEAWHWYRTHAGGAGQAAVVDTYWQTETGGTVVTSFPGGTPAKPGAATKPFFGIDAAVLRNDGTACPPGEPGFLVIKAPWPGMARGVWGEPERLKAAYFSDFPGRYFTGDSAVVDGEGDIRILGRTDDVINVSGHRLGTAEVEGALGHHAGVAESAVVGYPHSLKGEGIYAYVTLKGGVSDSASLRKELVATVRAVIGPIATPDVIHITAELPKTRSGKIMRRM
jgi:acetyl-CoA synthetase